MSSFDTANVEDLSLMFQDATSFQNNGGDSLPWSTEKVVDMTSLFERTSFGGDLSAFNVAKVTSFSRMFADNVALEDPSLGRWTTSNATDMRGFFDGCNNFRGDVSKFDTSQVTDMSAMFRGASSWTSDISDWNTAKVTDMRFQFEDCVLFNRNLEGFDTANVVNMAGQFRGASSFFGLVSNWNVGKVEDFSSQFEGAEMFDGAIAGWDMSSATDMSSMLKGASSFNRNISNWDIKSALNMKELFWNAGSLEQSLCWELGDRVEVTDMFVGSQACFDPNCVNETWFGAMGCEVSVSEANSTDSGSDTVIFGNGGGFEVSKQERESGASDGLHAPLFHGLVLVFSLALGWF